MLRNELKQIWETFFLESTNNGINSKYFMKVDIYFDTPQLCKTIKKDAADYCKNIVLTSDNSCPLYLYLNYETFFESTIANAQIKIKKINRYFDRIIN